VEAHALERHSLHNKGSLPSEIKLFGGRHINNNLKQTWLIRDVFYILLLYVMILLCLIFVESKILGVSPSEDPNSSPGLFLLEHLIDASIFTLLPIYIVSRYYDSDPSEIGITFDSYKKNLLIGVAFGLLLWGVISIFDAGIKSIWGEGPKNQYAQMLATSDNPVSFLVVLITLIILGPLSEEVYTRGFAYTILKKRYGRSIGLILSSLLFTGLHFNIRNAIQIFIASACLTFLFERTKSLLPVITAHAVINVCSVYIGKL
jgi:uncharacterized protein